MDLRAGALLLLAGLLAAGPALAQSPSPREYDVKAVFLFNFARFVEWPTSSVSQAAGDIVIGILGEDPFGEALDRAVRNETIREQSIVIRRAKRIEDLPPCHLLYLNIPDRTRLRSVLLSLRKRGILTVGEGEDFTRLGGIIGFRTRQNRVRFLINIEAAEAEGLRISSKLLQVADTAAPSE
jgi:hypothetical protein